MTRKRFIKLLMSGGHSKRSAVAEAAIVRALGLPYIMAWLLFDEPHAGRHLASIKDIAPDYIIQAACKLAETEFMRGIVYGPPDPEPVGIISSLEHEIGKRYHDTADAFCHAADLSGGCTASSITKAGAPDVPVYIGIDFGLTPVDELERELISSIEKERLFRMRYS